MSEGISSLINAKEHGTDLDDVKVKFHGRMRKKCEYDYALIAFFEPASFSLFFTYHLLLSDSLS